MQKWKWSEPPFLKNSHHSRQKGFRILWGQQSKKNGQNGRSPLSNTHTQRRLWQCGELTSRQGKPHHHRKIVQTISAEDTTGSKGRNRLASDLRYLLTATKSPKTLGTAGLSEVNSEKQCSTAPWVQLKNQSFDCTTVQWSTNEEYSCNQNPSTQMAFDVCKETQDFMPDKARFSAMEFLVLYSKTSVTSSSFRAMAVVSTCKSIYHLQLHHWRSSIACAQTQAQLLEMETRVEWTLNSWRLPLVKAGGACWLPFFGFKLAGNFWVWFWTFCVGKFISGGALLVGESPDGGTEHINKMFGCAQPRLKFWMTGKIWQPWCTRCGWFTMRGVPAKGMSFLRFRSSLAYPLLTMFATFRSIGNPLMITKPI